MLHHYVQGGGPPNLWLGGGFKHFHFHPYLGAALVSSIVGQIDPSSFNLSDPVSIQSLILRWKSHWLQCNYGDDAGRHGKCTPCDMPGCRATFDAGRPATWAASRAHEPCWRIPQWVISRTAWLAGKNLSFSSLETFSRVQYCTRTMEAVALEDGTLVPNWGISGSGCCIVWTNHVKQL